MSFLLDTNVVSESTKLRPDAGLMAWLDGVDENSVFLSVITLTELRYGLERLAPGRRRKQLDRWLEHELPQRFEGRILPVDALVADACGRLVARTESLGRPIEARDAFIAATAHVHRLTLVTRNASHFETTLKSILTPWTNASR
ncbi:MAG: type II toxin-antitoxin system VapC family toxin [Candidatus Korobacteraceae bacterium]